MKTSLLFLFLLLVASTGCDSSSTEPTAPQPAGKGSSFVYTQDEFDADGIMTGSTSTTYTIDSSNITLDSRTGVMRATATNDTMHFVRNESSMSIYREETQIFENLSLPQRWKNIVKANDTNVIVIGTYTGEAVINGANADITVTEREQYLGTSSVTIGGKTYEVVTKSFSVEVKVHIADFGITATTTVTEIDGYAPELGFLVSIKGIREADSEFSPIPPGRTELELSSYTLNNPVGHAVACPLPSI
jgi:hypothetical protein